MASLPPPRPGPPYGGEEERTPRPATIEGRLVRVETKQEWQERELAELRGVAHELRELTQAVRPLTERKKFHDKLILAAATLVVTGLLGFLLRLSWWVQSAKLP